MATLPGLGVFRPDFINGDAHYRGAPKQATKVWQGQQTVTRRTTGAQILIQDYGSLLTGEVERRLKQRKDPPVILGE